MVKYQTDLSLFIRQQPEIRLSLSTGVDISTQAQAQADIDENFID